MSLAWSLVALPILLTTNGEDSCPAGGGPGCIDAIVEEDLKCIKWRQTGGCNPNGPREKHGDKACSEVIPTGSSGFCQCGNVKKGTRRAREVTCDHRPFSCHTECLQLRRYMCLGWRQTGGCNADGEREPNLDQPCDKQIDATMSGFCECGDGRIIRKPGCKHGEFMEPFTCKDECAAEADLYEELGVDSGASEKDIKQAFRKLSLKYHPDKTRNDEVLTARFQAIREAYEIISAQDQRALYDAAGLKMVFEARNNRIEKGGAMNGQVHVSLEGMYNGEEIVTSVQRKVICRGCKEKHTPRCQKCNQRCADELETRDVRMGPMIMKQQVQVPSQQKCRVEDMKLTVPVERGMSPGDTIVFKSMGEQQPNKVPGDVVLTLKERKHKVFSRVGVDLHMQVEITLREALLGWERTFAHLDGRQITVGHDGVTTPFALMKIEGEGMPHRGDPTSTGSMIIKCKIIMPEDGRAFLRENALGSSKSEL
jgi:DnaJ-class molecular chaperone